MEPAEIVERDHRPWWLRLRSALLLALLLAALGLATAALFGAAAVAVTAALNQALG